MFDIGFLELMIIGVVALLVIGPDKLPGVARTAGTWVGRTRRFIAQVKDDVNLELRQEELKKAIERDAGLDEIKQIMNTDQFTLEDDDTPDYQVKAIPDEKPEAENEITENEKVANTENEFGEDYDDLSGSHQEYEPLEEKIETSQEPTAEAEIDSSHDVKK